MRRIRRIPLTPEADQLFPIKVSDCVPSRNGGKRPVRSGDPADERRIIGSREMGRRSQRVNPELSDQQNSMYSVEKSISDSKPGQ